MSRSGTPQRRVVALTITYVVASLALLNAAGWFYYTKTARYVREQEAALDGRLRATADRIVRELDPFHLSVLAPGDEHHHFYQRAHLALQAARDDQGVDAIHILRTPDFLIASSGAQRSIGEAPPREGLDPETIASALRGRAGVSLPMERGGVWHKCAAVPVRDADGSPVAAVVVRASAGAVEPLRAAQADLLHLMLGIAGMSVAAAAVLSAVLFATLRRLLREQEAVQRGERLALAGTLAAGVAHEIRNPLGVISGLAELLGERSAAGSREAKLSGEIVREVQRLNAVVGGFLDLARPAAPEVRSVAVREILSRPLEVLRPSFERRKIRLVNEAEQAIVVRADPARIEQVLLNLLLNARDATPEGGTVTVRATRAGRRATIEVADGGPGVPERDRSRIFEPFFTTKETGTGLGLAVARRIAEEHGGSLELRAGGSGARFALELPVDRSARR